MSFPCFGDGYKKNIIHNKKKYVYKKAEISNWKQNLSEFEQKYEYYAFTL